MTHDTGRKASPATRNCPKRCLVHTFMSIIPGLILMQRITKAATRRQSINKKVVQSGQPQTGQTLISVV